MWRFAFLGDVLFPCEVIADPELPLLHERVYDVKAYRKSDNELLLRGRLHDQKPPGLMIDNDPEPMTIHKMVVDLVVTVPDMVITHAEAHMETHPHEACPNVLPDYGKLVGLSIARGYTHKVRELFGGPRACTHITILLQAMAPVVHQSMWTLLNPAPDPDESPAAPEVPSADEILEYQRERFPLNKNTCHVWSEDGPMFAQLESGTPVAAPVWAKKRLDELGMTEAEWYASRYRK